MDGVCAYGVVKDGRVVLEAPLPLADGTRVAVVEPATTQPTDDNSSVGPGERFETEEERLREVEQTVLDAIRMRGSPAEIAEVERLVREARGANG